MLHRINSDFKNITMCAGSNYISPETFPNLIARFHIYFLVYKKEIAVPLAFLLKIKVTICCMWHHIRSTIQRIKTLRLSVYFTFWTSSKSLDREEDDDCCIKCILYENNAHTYYMITCTGTQDKRDNSLHQFEQQRACHHSTNSKIQQMTVQSEQSFIHWKGRGYLVTTAFGEGLSRNRGGVMEKYPIRPKEDQA